MIHTPINIEMQWNEYQSCTIVDNQVYCILDYDAKWIMLSNDIETNVISREDVPWPSSGRPILFSCQDCLLAMFIFRIKIEVSTCQIPIEWRINNIVWSYDSCMKKWIKFTNIPPLLLDKFYDTCKPSKASYILEGEDFQEVLALDDILMFRNNYSCKTLIYNISTSEHRWLEEFE
jgi:hypothetical protein